MTPEVGWNGYGDPPAELVRKRLEQEDLNRRSAWVRGRRMLYSSDRAYTKDLRAAADGWDAIAGPDGKGVEK